MGSTWFSLKHDGEPMQLPSAWVGLSHKQLRAPATDQTGLLCLPVPLGSSGSIQYNSCIFSAPRDLWDCTLLHEGIDIGVVQKKLCQALENNTQGYFALNIECPEQFDVTWVLLCQNSDTLHKPPLLGHPSPPPSLQLNNSLQKCKQAGADLIETALIGSWWFTGLLFKIPTITFPHIEYFNSTLNIFHRQLSDFSDLFKKKSRAPD